MAPWNQNIPAMPAIRIILASASPRRARLLEQAGVSFRVVIPDVEEKQVDDAPHLTPTEIALNNACVKARSVSSRHPDEWVLSADTIVVHEGRLIGKPVDMEDARRILEALNGRTHRVITAAYLMRGNPFHQMPFSDVSHVTFHRLNAKKRDNYLQLINPFDKAGAYAAQEHTDLLIKQIKGSFTNVMGLPLEQLAEMLERVARHSEGARRKPKHLRQTAGAGRER